MSLWWFGWSGTLFLSSTRVIFAASIDRMLPEWVSRIEPRTKTPFNALLLMVIPAVIISYLYAFNIFGMRTLALDATVVIAITFLGTTIAGTVMPWRAKDVFDGSPIGKFKVPTWLGWIVTLAYAAAAVLPDLPRRSNMPHDRWRDRCPEPGCHDLVRGHLARPRHPGQRGDPAVDPVLRGAQRTRRAPPCR